MALGAIVAPPDEIAATAIPSRLAVLGGIGIGLAVAWIVMRIRTRIEDTPVEVTISLLTPYAAFLSAHRLGVSGVMATVS